jgi:uncharacterized iron-regulated protein
MRCSWKAILLPLLLPACATPTWVVATATDAVVTIDECADDLARADVVVLGEEHGTPAIHQLHHALLLELHERRPNLVIAMEMFERDVQTVLLQYLTDLVDESGFLARARPWGDYARDYRPVVEFAKANGIVVLAANAPRALARKAAKEGVAAVLGDPNVARETTAPADDYHDVCIDAMKGHPGSTPESLQREYAAQCLKDDTMAETITDHLRERAEVDDRPLVVLICGKLHSDHRRGVVARMQSRSPGLAIRVLSAETVADVGSGVYSSPRAVADYVVVAQRGDGRERPAAVAAVAAPAPSTAIATEPPPRAPAPAAAPPAAVRSPAAQAPANPEGQRPGLGLRPAYDVGGDGVHVEAVSPGSGAEAAGIEPGDVLLELAGVEIEDVQHYADVLRQQTIGKTVPVRIRRENAEVVLQVKVGVSSR